MAKIITTANLFHIQRWLCGTDDQDGFDAFDLRKIYMDNHDHLEKIVEDNQVVIDLCNLDWLKKIITDHIEYFGFTDDYKNRRGVYEYDNNRYYFRIPSDHNLNILTRRIAKVFKRQAQELLVNGYFD